MGLRRSLHLPDFRNPVGVVISVRIIPKVARCSQPWAGGRNPVGIVCGGGAIEGSILRADSIDGAGLRWSCGNFELSIPRGWPQPQGTSYLGKRFGAEITTPTGLRPPAQSCEERATLGKRPCENYNPNGVAAIGVTRGDSFHGIALRWAWESAAERSS